MESLLILRGIKVENANAIAGFTYGFPAISHFLGYVHALDRKAQTAFGEERPQLKEVAVVSHTTQVQAHRNHGYEDYSFALTRNPLTKQGNTPSFNEEARMHMTITLLIKMHNSPPWDEQEWQEYKTWLYQTATTQRLAGGTIVNLREMEVIEDIDFTEKNNDNKRLLRSLLPGFALVSRHQLLIQHQKQTGKTQLQAWMDFSALHYQAERKEADSELADWRVNKQYKGWLKPIAVGYQAISQLYEPGQVAKSRDNKTPVSFVETLYSLGQWLSPHRIEQLEQLFWQYQYLQDKNQYLCINAYQPPEL